ncbi:hypothetical protein THAOC_13220, partial [Thalassiosira oceanica]
MKALAMPIRSHGCGLYRHPLSSPSGPKVEWWRQGGWAKGHSCTPVGVTSAFPGARNTTASGRGPGPGVLPPAGPRRVFLRTLALFSDDLCSGLLDCAQILAKQWCASMGDEVAIRVHGVFPLPMGIEREDR